LFYLSINYSTLYLLMDQSFIIKDWIVPTSSCMRYVEGEEEEAFRIFAKHKFKLTTVSDLIIYSHLPDIRSNLPL